ncbi:hypothetical protein PISL3812_03518 [Talaromyces islandicus]|uniref:Uncharacterized protein n=1 Tax=Talaromyces islandicus TaxID=28573 RepID=A0A0U1LTS4_TALIS|nr:hypothetical protein PISL3812_03518 [Talaromyces islandicus]
MEQRLVPGWTLIAPRKETLCRFEGADRSDYPPVCRPAEDHGWNSWHRLARIPREKQFSTQTEAVGESHVVGENIISAIEALPGEIVSAILMQLSLFTHQDIINFGLSSLTLWRHILAYLHLDCTRTSGVLRDAEISLFCDVRFDLPESFKRNNYALIDKVLRRRYGRRQLGSWLTNEELIKSPLSTDCYAVMETTPELWMRTLKETAESHFDQKVMSCLADELHWACNIAPFGESMPDSRIWVLRNLSTMEYVRCCRDARCGGKVLRGQKPTELGVEDVISLHIQCSNASTGYYGEEYSFTTPRQGSWSGHCLEIVLLDDVSDELLPSDKTSTRGVWKDVTEEVFLDMQNLPTAISRYKTRVNEYHGRWYALKNDIGRLARDKKL